jgi:hypothetical protein
MFLRLRIRSNEPRKAPPRQGAGYVNRPASFGVSLGLHALIVAILFFNPTRVPSEETTLYRDIIQPQSHKIIFYKFHKKLPEVNAARKMGTSLRPRGTELSRQTMIAMSPNAKSDKQFIWQPFPKIEVPRDLALPNLIARANTALPPPPAERKRPEPANPSPPDAKGDVHRAEHAEAAAPKAPRKAFVPPPVTPQNHAPVQAAMLDAPDASNAVRTKTVPDALAALKLRKTFVPPPPQERLAHSPDVGLMAAPASGVSASAVRGVRSTLPEGLGSPSLGAGIAPPPNAPPGATASTGNANADFAIAGLHPAGDLSGPLPDGSRPGRFAKAPELGEPATGEGTGAGALSVPDLTIHEDKINSGPVPVANVSRRAVLYSETVRSIPVSTLSVPLRPSSRTIPPAIDARFQGRSVYTLVVPIENLPAYGGDWILWFAERDPKPGDAPSMHAPVPFRKLEPVGAALSGNHVERRVQLAAVIKQDGTVDRVSLMKGAPPAVAQAVIQDLQSWEFKPATRAGTPVDVDVVVEIPFNLSVELASAGPK